MKILIHNLKATALGAKMPSFFTPWGNDWVVKAKECEIIFSLASRGGHETWLFELILRMSCWTSRTDEVQFNNDVL